MLRYCSHQIKSSPQLYEYIQNYIYDSYVQKESIFDERIALNSPIICDFELWENFKMKSMHPLRI